MTQSSQPEAPIPETRRCATCNGRGSTGRLGACVTCKGLGFTTHYKQPEAQGRAEAEAAKVGDLVWFRMSRMYGDPPPKPVRAMVTAVRGGGRVDLEIGCEDMSVLAGTASSVLHRALIPPALQDQMGGWWSGELPETSHDH